MIHPFFPLVRHENQLQCPACNDYAIHFAYGAAASTSSFMTAVGSLADRAARFSGRESSSDLHAQVDRLRHQRDKLVQDLAAAREELARLSRGVTSCNQPAPMTWPVNLSGPVRHNQWVEDRDEIKQRGVDYSKTWDTHAIVLVVKKNGSTRKMDRRGERVNLIAQRCLSFLTTR